MAHQSGARYADTGSSDVDTRTKNVLSICSGVAGLELGLHAALGGRTRTVCYVENEISVAAILAARMEDGSLDPAPIWTDLRTFDPEPWRGKVDILAGGFPCQPFSVAGLQKGTEDPRNLWPSVARIIRGVRPSVVFLENVPGILPYYFDTIRPELSEMGYVVAEGLFTAAETGAPHKRERLFILAHADRNRTVRNQSQHWEGTGIEQDSEELAEFPLFPPGPNDREGWEWLLARWPDNSPTYCKDGHDVQPEMQKAQSSLLRMVDGPMSGVDRRLRAVGNGVVPAVAALAYRELAALNE